MGSCLARSMSRGRGAIRSMDRAGAYSRTASRELMVTSSRQDGAAEASYRVCVSHAFPRFTAAVSSIAVFDQQLREARLGVLSGEELQVHLLHRTEAMRHRHTGNRRTRTRPVGQEQPCRGVTV